MKRIIIIMAKVPIAGTVKTRLQPYLTPEKCAELAAVFLRDTENKTKVICKNTILAYSPVAQRNTLEKMLHFENTFIKQQGEDLGEKMSNAFKFAFERDSDSIVVMIGTDSPTFPAQFIEQAFESLEKKSPMVLGKTNDGGFYLIGLRKFVPHLFDGIAWSSPTVYEQTVNNANLLGIENIEQIPVWYDVDTPAELLYLFDELSADNEMQKRAPATYQWFLENLEIFNGKT